MKKQYQGFIFVMTLITTAVISLLVLTSMQHILLYYKAINKQEQLHQSFYQLEEVTLQLARSPVASVDAGCVTHTDSANQVMQKLMHREGCALQKAAFDYQYFIEDLGEFPCLLVYEQGQKRATYHRRISVVQMEEGYPASLLQIRFITKGSILKCDRKEHSIGLGVSSWRYLA